MTIREWQAAVAANETAHGFNEGEYNLDQKLLLSVGEIIEAQNEIRAGRGAAEIYYTSEHPGKPEGFPIEVADAVIRLMGICEQTGVDLQNAMELKQAYNLTRPYKHGKAF